MPKPEEELTEEERQRRFEEAVKAGLKSPPKPLKEKPPIKRVAAPPARGARAEQSD